jgi:hypothetical protein
MALIKCKECGKEISDTAVKCPHCGIDRVIEKTGEATIGKQHSSSKMPLVAIVGILVIGVIVLIYILKSQSTNSQSTEQKPSYAVEDESGLYRLQKIAVHVDADDFIGNDDGTSGFYAPEIYAIVYHNQDKIVNTYDKAAQDKFDATFSPSVTIGWAKGDTLTVQIWDKDVMDDDQLFTVKIDHLRNGEFVTKSEKGSEITLTMSKIK